MQKTSFQNSSPFSHSFKMFECKSTQENCEIWNIRQFSPDMVSENWLAFPIHLIFWYAIFLKHYLEHCRIKKNTQRFNTIHSWPKEMHHLEKIPSLHWLQWDLSCFVMSPKWHVLKQVRIVRDPWGISQRGFLQVTLRTIWQNVHDPGSGSVTQGHREKWVQKSCVSFEGECTNSTLC